LIAEIAECLVRAVGCNALRLCWRDHHEAAKEWKGEETSEFHRAQSVAQIAAALTPFYGP
jgi:hypothetical protein